MFCAPPPFNGMFSKLVTTLMWNLPFKNIGSSVVSLAEVVSSSVALPAYLVAPIGHVIQPINNFLTLIPTAYQILRLKKKLIKEFMSLICYTVFHGDTLHSSDRYQLVTDIQGNDKD